jgi:hypothetical protein
MSSAEDEFALMELADEGFGGKSEREEGGNEKDDEGSWTLHDAR